MLRSLTALSPTTRSRFCLWCAGEDGEPDHKAGAKNGIESVRKNAPDAPVVEQTETGRTDPARSAAGTRSISVSGPGRRVW
jgi:hypothetical protein